MTQNANLAALSAAGVSVWLDDLSRDRLKSGNLQQLIDTKSVVGVTTNPSIFQKALAEGDAYDGQIAELVSYVRRQFAPDKPAWTGVPAAIARTRQAASR